jgi:hypothetical protein
LFARRHLPANPYQCRCAARTFLLIPRRTSKRLVNERQNRSPRAPPLTSSTCARKVPVAPHEAQSHCLSGFTRWRQRGTSRGAPLRPRSRMRSSSDKRSRICRGSMAIGARQMKTSMPLKSSRCGFGARQLLMALGDFDIVTRIQRRRGATLVCWHCNLRAWHRCPTCGLRKKLCRSRTTGRAVQLYAKLRTVGVG